MNQYVTPYQPQDFQQPDEEQQQRPLLLWLVLAVFAYFAISNGWINLGGNNTSELKPRKELLGVVVRAFAYNLEQDGKQPVPAIGNTADLAEAFNVYGSRTTTGQAYKAAFPDVFRELGLGIKQAAEETTETRMLSDKVSGGKTVRQAIVDYLLSTAKQLEAGGSPGPKLFGDGQAEPASTDPVASPSAAVTWRQDKDV